MPPGSDSDLWEDLLLAIEEGQVVPLVGQQMLLVDVEDGRGPRWFHHLVAERLAEELRVPASRLPAQFDTNDVICACESFHGDPMAINPTVVRIVRTLKPSIPEPLRLLAEIPKLRLFVSTTYDTLLEDAITSVRGRAPAVVAFPPVSSTTDFDADLMDARGSLLFQILGRVSASASFAVTEGQVLEQMHDFMAGARRPEKLIARLKESHLMMLGVSFPDWLARFLLRLARAKPLWDSRPLMEIIADGGSTQNDLAFFLRHFSPLQSRLYSGGSPIDFVRELHRRWFERHPAIDPKGSSLPAAASEKPIEMAPGSIFLSYAHEDREATLRLADTLTRAGLEVWMDSRLHPGDDFRNVIERHIRDCCAFVPVLSRHTQADDERWFRKEWAQACDRARYYFGTERAFLFPVVIDDTPPGQLVELRREIFGRSAVLSPAGAAPASLIEQLDQAQKAWRKQFSRV